MIKKEDVQMPEPFPADVREHLLEKIRRMTEEGQLCWQKTDFAQPHSYYVEICLSGSCLRLYLELTQTYGPILNIRSVEESTVALLFSDRSEAIADLARCVQKKLKESLPERPDRQLLGEGQSYPTLALHFLEQYSRLHR